MQKKILYISTIVITAFLSNLLFAGTTGKIAGRVFDKNSGEPLIGTNIVIEGMPLGAQVDFEGDYFILNVPPGNYTVTALYVGYNTQQVQKVMVKADLTSIVDFELGEAIMEGETIVVVAERAMIQKDATATAAVISADEIEASPIESFSDIAQTKAGINAGPDGTLHFRGGRGHEVAYMVDGVTVTDAFDGGNSVDVSTNAIEELSIITGAFSAEYGQAMSGIVNIVTKEGGSKYKGKVSFQSGDVLTNHSDIFLDEITNYDFLNTHETEFNLSGPFPVFGEKIKFNFSARYLDDAGYIYGERIHEPTDIADSVRTGDGEFVLLNPFRKFNFHGKFKFDISPQMDFYLSTIYENRKSQSYSHQASKVPNGFPWRYSTGYHIIGKLNHNFSSNAFYTLAVSYVKDKYERYLDEDINSEKYVSGQYRVAGAGQQFYTGGTDNYRLFEDQETLNGKFDLTAQLWKSHEIKTGIELKKHSLFRHSYNLDVDKRAEVYTDSNGNGQWDDGEPFNDIDRDGNWDDARDDNNDGIPGNTIELTGYTNDKWTRNPLEISAYLQDKIELKDMVLNLGVRVDYFEPDGRVLADPTDPDITNPVKNENIWKDYGSDGNPNTNDQDGTENNGLLDPGEHVITLDERRTYWYKDVDPTIQFSPRVSLAFPISAQGKLFFSYGHFLQLPPYNYLYRQFENRIKPGLMQTDMGNSALKPEKAISYEIGVEQQFMEDVALYLKIYQKDMRNTLGMDIVMLPNTDAYAIFVNRDYGRVRGVNMTLSKRFSNFFSASVDYTFQIAEGNESNPTDTRQNFRMAREDLKKIVPLDWDQTHTLRINTSVGVPNDWYLSILGRIETGYPYTPMGANELIQIAEKNSGNKIPIIKFDLRARKTFPIQFGDNEYYLSIYTKIYNLFDRLNEDYVWDATGRATYGLGMYGAVFDPEWQRRPHWFHKPREVFVGVEFEF